MLARLAFRALAVIAAAGFVGSSIIHLASLVWPGLRSEITFDVFEYGLMALFALALLLKPKDTDVPEGIPNTLAGRFFGPVLGMIENAPDIAKKLLLVLVAYSFVSAAWMLSQNHWQLPNYYEFNLRWFSPGWMVIYGFVALAFYSKQCDLEEKSASQDDPK